MELRWGKVRRLFGSWKTRWETRRPGGSKETGLGRILPLARACVLCAGVLLLQGAPSDAASSVLINGKPLAQIDDIVKETTGSRGVVKESLLKFLKANDGKFRFYPTQGDDKGSPSEKAQVNLEDDGGYTNTGLHPTVGKKRAEDGSLVVMYPSSNEGGVTLCFAQVKPDEKGGLAAAKGWSTTIEASGYPYVTDSAAGLFPDGEGGSEAFVVAYFTAGGDPWGKKRPGYEQTYTAWLAFVDPAAKRVETRQLGAMNAYFPSVRVAAGDLDHDGRANEFALIRTGRDNNYFLQVYRVSRSASGGVEASPIYETGLGSRDGKGEKVDGCDVVAGDFNGDGRTELAAVYADKWKDSDAYPTVRTYGWNGSGFSGSETRLDDDDQRVGGTSWTLAYVPHFGMIASAGDLDGDGKDEIVFLSAKYGSSGGELQVSVWGTDGALKPARKFWRSTGQDLAGYGGVGGVDRAECSYLLRSASLALVPLGGTSERGAPLRKVFFSLSQGDDTDKRSSDYFTGDRLWYLSPEISGGSLTGLSSPVLHTQGGAGRALALLPGDFYGESVALGEPTHLVFADERSYVAEIQTPPYHVDYVQAPFEVNGVRPERKSVMNLSWMGSSVAYSKSQTESSKADTSFSATSALEWGVSASVGGRYKLIGANASGGYKDTSARVESKANSSQATVATTITSVTDGSDNVVLYKTDRHVWRYPVLGPAPQAPDAPLEEGEKLNGDRFMTFSLCDAPTIVQGDAGQSLQFDDYNPIHEEGNLFSYPTKVENTPYYGDLQRVLSNRLNSAVGGRTVLDLAVSQVESDVSGVTTKSKKAANGSLNVSLGAPKVFSVGVTSTVGYSNELTNTETFTKTYQESEKFTVTLNNAQLPFNSSYVKHLIETQLYADAAGVMKVAFAVDLADSNALVWRNAPGGLYADKPDPALVLPARYNRRVQLSESGTTRVVWSANEDRLSATQVRGIGFRDEGAQRWATSALVRGGQYKIQIPLYNASFKDAGDVEVEMRLRAGGGDTDLRTLDRKTVRLGGWTQGTEANKATASFTWTVPNDLAPGNYDLHFVVDPDNKLDELHEEWDYKNDPGGNNVGRYPIAVLAEEPKAAAGLAVVSGRTASAAVTEGDFKMTFKPVRSDDARSELTLPEFRAELLKQTGDFRAHATIRYSGSETLTNLRLTVSRVKGDGSESRVVTRTIPAIFPNTERSLSFIVSPSRMREGTLAVDLVGDKGVSLHWPRGDANDPKDPPAPGGKSSKSGGGCDAGWSGLALVLAAVFLLKAKGTHSLEAKGRVR